MIDSRTWLIASLLIAVAPAPTLVQAQESDETLDEGEGEKDVIYKKDQVINFEGLDVQGEIKKPAGAYMADRKKSTFSPLIKFRQNWDEEAVQSLQQKK